jgi:hypothetical protein
MPARTEVKGIVRLNGKPVGPDEVLAISEDMAELLAAGSTDSQGRFTLSVPEATRRVIIVAKLRGTTIGLRHREIALPLLEPVSVDFEASQFKWLRAEIESTSGTPDSLDVFADPINLDGVPDAMREFFRQSRIGVRNAYFAKVSVRGSSFALQLQAGTYRIGGERVNYDQPLATVPVPNFKVSAATLAPENVPLPGDESLGFVIDMDQDRRVVFWLRVVEDAELLR